MYLRYVSPFFSAPISGTPSPGGRAAGSGACGATISADPEPLGGVALGNIVRKFSLPILRRIGTPGAPSRSCAGKLSGGKLNAVTVRAKNIGAEIPAGKSVATVESSKYVGPVPAPVAGVLKRANDKLAADPNLAITDPYGEGWIVELAPANWDADKAGLLTGQDGLAAYKAKLEAENISCE